MKTLFWNCQHIYPPICPPQARSFTSVQHHSIWNFGSGWKKTYSVSWAQGWILSLKEDKG